jgi:hypothetical protein
MFLSIYSHLIKNKLVDIHYKKQLIYCAIEMNSINIFKWFIDILTIKTLSECEYLKVFFDNIVYIDKVDFLKF